MAKLKDTKISGTEIREFADSQSDFGFELKVLASLIALSIDCEHNGTYDDPVTQRPRQFDIRALLDFGLQRIRLAVECKNLRENFPLVVFEVPRTAKESYHDLILSHKPLSNGYGSRAFDSHGSVLRIDSEFSFYQPGEYVGKSCTQVGKLPSGDLTGNDAEVYDKWYQAIHSAHDLVDSANDDWESNEENLCLTFVLPVLVVPDNRLWRIKYKTDGTRESEPEAINRSTMFIDKFVASSNRMTGISIFFSHLEVVTETGLSEMCKGFFSGDLIRRAFPQDGISALFPGE
jgi:hypothetical protein